MKTEVLTVKRELPAMRCEICHQADCFTPETNVCTRCENVSIEVQTPVVFSQRPVFQTFVSGEPFWNRTLLYFVFSIFPLVGFEVGFLVSSLSQGVGNFIFLVTVLECFFGLVWAVTVYSRKKKTDPVDWPVVAMIGSCGLFLNVALMVLAVILLTEIR